MLRNLMVTGVVSMVMGVTAVAFQSLAPREAQPTMAEDASSPPTETVDQAGSPTSSMDGQQAASQASLTSAQIAQTPGMPVAPVQATAGMMGGGQPSGMMMCPCMQMMMGGPMGGGPMGGPMSTSSAATAPLSNPRTKEQAQERAGEYLQALGNPNLQAGEANETAASYEVEVLTKDGSLVNRLIIDKRSGELKTQY